MVALLTYKTSYMNPWQVIVCSKIVTYYRGRRQEFRKCQIALCKFVMEPNFILCLAMAMLQLQYLSGLVERLVKLFPKKKRNTLVYAFFT